MIDLVIEQSTFLANGAEGEVFSGRWVMGPGVSRLVAIKTSTADRFTEVEHLSRLRHTNIVQLFIAGTWNSKFAIVMEFCTEGSLKGILRSAEHVCWDEWLRWVREIVEGMHYLHSKNIIHRDLKPDNILLTKMHSSRDIRITDFGQSRETIISRSKSVTAMSAAGTCCYMAPEMIRGEPCTPKIDSWSFGIVLWEMICRQSPYQGLQMVQITYHVGSNLIRLKISSAAPELLSHLVERCMSTNFLERPSFLDILVDIEAIKKIQITEEDWKDICQCCRAELSESTHTITAAQDVDEGELIVPFIAGVSKQEASVEDDTAPINIVYQHNEVEILQHVLDQEAESNFRDPKKDTASIHLACQQNNVELLQHHLAQGIDVNFRDLKGWTPLHYAAQAGATDSVNLLLKSGADRSLLNEDNKDPITLALAAHRFDVVPLLLDNIFDLRKKTSEKLFRRKIPPVEEQKTSADSTTTKAAANGAHERNSESSASDRIIRRGLHGRIGRGGLLD